MAPHPHHRHDHAAHGDAHAPVAAGAHGHDHGPAPARGHAHGHGHAHAPAQFDRAFAIGITLNLAFVAVEAAYGWLANSLALLADAGHNLGDVLGLALAWVATMLVRRLPTARRTYGLRRSTILAALANALLLLVAVAGIAWEAVTRLAHPEAVASGTVVAVAAAGIAVNGITAWLFSRGAQGDINVRGAFLHMAADAAVSAGVVAAALTMRATGWLWLDPAASLVVAAVITVATWGLLRDSVNLALDAVPAHIDPAAVTAYLAGLPGVSAVHHLHIWGMSTTHVALTVHLVKPDAHVDDALLAEIGRELHARFGIDHATVQLELGDAAHACDVGHR
jgi:cobalt-zinc-cadmium efflux system protein